jgi:hypothetical protein
MRSGLLSGVRCLPQSVHKLFTLISERCVAGDGFISDTQGVKVNWIRTHKGIVAGVAAVGVAGVVFLVVWFQPQTAFIDEVVDDTIPAAAPEQPTDEPTPQTSSEAPDSAAEPPVPEEEMEDDMEEPVQTPGAVSYPLTLGGGAFIDLAHTGSGDVSIIELEDGTRILRFENLDVLNGPDLRVILSPSSLVDDDGAYDDGDFLDLGELKGNKGNQNYEIPPEFDLDDFATVAIWCRRFNVSFNAAPIR